MAKSKSRRRRPTSNPIRLAIVFGVALVGFLAVIWYVADRGLKPGNAPGREINFASRLNEIAIARGAANDSVHRDNPIQKVDGVFVRTWRIDLPDVASAQAFVADVEEAAAARSLASSRLAPAGAGIARVRVDLGPEAFDLRVGVTTPRQAEIIPSPEPTSVPTATPRPELPPDARGRLAILLDDAGQAMDLVPRAAQLPPAIAVAVLPFLPHSAETATELHNAGHEIWLHLPMEATGAENPGPGAILVGMTSDEIRTTVHSALNNVPHVVGVNNHMGSKATANLRTMTWVMQELSPRGMAFLDSRTTVQTVAEDAARAQGIPTGRRHVFLDNVRQRAAVRAQLDEAIYRARSEGEAVAIGHLTEVTIDVLTTEAPGLSDRGVDLVSPSGLMR